MISQEQNELLTQVGPSKPMGELLRRYWHPVAAVAELPNRGTKKVRILGEDLVLYRDLKENLGLVDEQCPHRKASMEYGIPEENGIRCPYHGWKFDNSGACMEQPAEPENSTFKDRVCIKSYPVKELMGLIFAYLGPAPAPLLPNYDLFVKENSVRLIGGALLPCNWVQTMENSVDPVHTEWLHGVYMDYVLGQKGEGPAKAGFQKAHKKIGFDVFEHGIIKRRLLEGQTEEDSEDWRTGHPLIFPNILKVGSRGSYSFQMRIPVDDTHTMHYWYHCLTIDPDIDIEQPNQEIIPYHEIPFMEANGKMKVDTVAGQDIMCWVTQGAIADRTEERLGTSDKGVIFYRQLLQEQLNKIQKGEDPLAVLRDPDKNVCINLPLEEKKAHKGSFDRLKTYAYDPEMLDFLNRYEKALVEQGKL
jgi:5,5'-dehydrodivanillate O-demethylase